jgi:nucleoside-diphosphate-sugar epimerase
MRVVIVGATGFTGSRLIAPCLDRGHAVTVLVRDPRKLEASQDRVRVVTGDALDDDAVDAALADQDAVLCALGAGTDLRPTTVLSDATRTLVAGMVRRHVPRIVAVLSGWLFYPEVPPIFAAITSDHERQLGVLRASDRAWIAVCPPQITDDPQMPGIRAARGALPTGARRIRREALARFVVEALDTDEWNLCWGVGQ